MLEAPIHRGTPPSLAAAPPRLGTDDFAGLNDEQRCAVEHGCGADGNSGDDAQPLLIIAGAGSGKTHTLAFRLAHLVRRGADPRRILLLTFSRRAAADLDRRAADVLQRVLGLSAGAQSSALPWAGTFHAVGARLLREYAARLGLAESFTILDRSDAEDLVAIVRESLGFARTKARFPGKAACLAIYSHAVNSRQPVGETLRQTFPWCAQWAAELKALFGAYAEAKQAQHVLDYDDLLLLWAQAVADEALAREIGQRFDHVLVDEYQDTNRLQAAILVALKPDGRGVTVVGDDAQSIYAFRAATVRNILDFPQQFARPARLVTLDRNYRSTHPILDASNAVIGLASERFTKNLWSDRASAQKPRLVAVRDEADQARRVAEQALLHLESGIMLRAQAVLFRSSSHSAQVELELGRRNIPFVKYGGLKFLEAAHVKDVLSVLRWAQNPRSRTAGFRVVRLLPGIGPATATRLLDAMDESADPVAALRAFIPPWTAAEACLGLVEAYATLRRAGTPWPADLEVAVRWYEPQLQRLYDDAAVRLRDIAQLIQIAATYPSRERFLTELTLDPPGATSDEAGPPLRDDDYLVLSTIHSAKGQEWKAVQVLNVVDGCIPSDLGTGTSAEIEEERRLLYVAMTRAKDHLDLIVPQRFHAHQQASQGDRHVYASRTRFIPSSLLGCFESCAWPIACPDDAPAEAREPAAAVDVLAQIRALWR